MTDEQPTNSIEVLLTHARTVRDLEKTLEASDPSDPLEALIRPATELALKNTVEQLGAALESDEVRDQYTSLNAQRIAYTERLQGLPNISDEEKSQLVRDALSSEVFKPLRDIEAAKHIYGAYATSQDVIVEHVDANTDSQENDDASVSASDADISTQETISVPREVYLSIRQSTKVGTTLKVGRGRGLVHRLTAPQETHSDYAEHKIAALKLFVGLERGEEVKIDEITSVLEAAGLLDESSKRNIHNALRSFLRGLRFYDHDLILHNGKRGPSSGYYVNPAFIIPELTDRREPADPSKHPKTSTVKDSGKKDTPQTAESKYSISDTMTEKVQKGQLPVFEIVAALKTLEDRSDLIKHLGLEWIDDSYGYRIMSILEAEGIKAPEEYHDPQKKDVLRVRFMNELADIISNDDLFEQLFNLVDSQAEESDGHKAIQEMAMELAGIDDTTWDILKTSVISATRTVKPLNSSFTGSAASSPAFETNYITKIDGEVQVVSFQSNSDIPMIRRTQDRWSDDDQVDDAATPTITDVVSTRPVHLERATDAPDTATSLGDLAITAVKGTGEQEGSSVDNSGTGKEKTPKKEKAKPEWLIKATGEAKKYLNQLIEKAQQLSYTNPEAFLADENLTAQQVLRLIHDNIASAAKTLHVAVESGIVDISNDFDKVDTHISLTEVLMLSTFKGQKPGKGITDARRLKKLREEFQKEIVEPFVSAHRNK